MRPAVPLHDPASAHRALSVRRAAILVAASVSGRVPGFLVPVLVAAVFGAARQTDAYFVVYNAVLLVGGTLGQAVDVSIVPFAARRLLAARGAAGIFLSRTSRWVLLTAAIAWLLLVPLLLLASRGLGRAVGLYGLSFMPLVLCWAWASVYSGALVAQGRIGQATASLGWRGIGGLAGLALAPAGGGLWAVSVGLGAGELVRVMWLRHLLHTGPAPASYEESSPSTGSFGRALVPIVVESRTVSVCGKSWTADSYPSLFAASSMQSMKHRVRSCGVVGTLTSSIRLSPLTNPSVKVPPVSMSMLNPMSALPSRSEHQNLSAE